jgi:putative DNA primase/helicase
MLEYGFDVYPEPDGQIHRFKGPDDKRPNGWYFLDSNHGAFGNWKTGVVVKWSERGKLTGQEQRDLDQQIRQQRKRRRKEREQRQQAAAAEAMKLWRNAVPVLSHPYLQRKQVHPYGIRQTGDALVIPMYRNRELRSIQRINADGRKRFLKDGDIYATYYPIGKLNGRLWISEGFATSASVHEATGDAVACAFSGSNMAKVAKAFRKKYPNLDIRIAGDAGGERYADKAMIACLGKSALPVFDDDDDGSDWNDFTCLYGRDTTKEALYGRV